MHEGCSELNRFAPFFEQKRSEVRKQRQEIQLVLSKGPATVTEIAKRSGLQKNLIVWNLMGLLKWGTIEVTGEENHELVYSLKEL
jgi:predicted transcriptional regulator